MGLAITLSVSSQVIYTCDFENAQERQTWQLNVGKNAALIDRAENKWYIEEAGNHGEKGSYGLFVSNDGTNGTYKNSKSFIMFAILNCSRATTHYLSIGSVTPVLYPARDYMPASYRYPTQVPA